MIPFIAIIPSASPTGSVRCFAVPGPLSSILSNIKLYVPGKSRFQRAFIVSFTRTASQTAYPVSYLQRLHVD